jgi:hypothetical protein
MSCCYHWEHHCPYHHHYHRWPGWAEAYPAPASGPPPVPPGSARDEYVRLMEAERAVLEQRLRRLEDQLTELQRERTSK